jgi:CheY-like chemotaxis protein
MRVVGRDADAHENARTILERQVSQMARLVDDLMDVSRINRGKIQLEKAPVELSTVINHAVETSRPLIEEMRHELVIDLPSGSLVIDVDMARLSQVLSNLLNNAAKYSEAESRIWLNAEAGDDAVEIRVRDAGIGLGAQNLARIFDMFSQVDQSTAKTRGGLGIGLTLAKTLVEMHGGSIVARSEGLGKGTEFVVRLPIDSGLGVAGTLRHTTEASSSASSFRILIIDDNRDAADSLQFLLENAGHQVMTAYDPHRGLELAEETRPDIIVLDIGLPSLDGFEVSRRIKRRDWSANCRIIAVTGWGTDEDRRKSRDTGIDYHLVKPVDPHTLMQLLAELDAN